MKPGAIIVPAQDQARFHRFTIALSNLQRPEGSQLIFGLGMSIVDNLNSALRQLRPEDEWVWFVGDDHVFQADTLMRLLERDKDVIAPLCVRRHSPYQLVHADTHIEGTDFYRLRQISELPRDGEPFQVAAPGSAMLVKRHVLDEMGDPWFGTTHGRLNEDYHFANRATELGFTCWVDPQVALGHIGFLVAYPQMRDGQWGLTLDFHGEGENQAFYPGGIKEGGVGILEPATPAIKVFEVLP